ncbi:MAG: ribonuclease HI family protein [Phycisphaeraceae bacterium]
MNVLIHTDGGSRGNPGPAGAGIVICRAEDKQPLLEAGYFLGRATNNAAEYQALIVALERAMELGATNVAVRCDSELLTRQIHGQYRVKSADLKPLFERARELLGRFEGWDVRHVRRRFNARADELANLAMDEGRDVVATGAGAGASAAAAEPGGGVLPCFEAELTGKKSRCAIGQSTGNAYTFGPTTPEGFCVFAAAAAFGRDPFGWPAGREETVRCGRCGQSVRTRRIT